MSSSQLSEMPTPSRCWNWPATSRSTPPLSSTAELSRSGVSTAAATTTTPSTIRPTMSPVRDFFGGAPYGGPNPGWPYCGGPYSPGWPYWPGCAYCGGPYCAGPYCGCAYWPGWPYCGCANWPGSPY